MLPRIPFVEETRDFWSFSKAGRELANLHLNYETVPPSQEVTVTGAETGHFTVEKMRFPKKGQKETIIYNSAITIQNIPAKAWEYTVNGKSAIEWIMNATKSPPTKRAASPTTPTTGLKRSATPATFLTYC